MKRPDPPFLQDWTRNCSGNLIDLEANESVIGLTARPRGQGPNQLSAMDHDKQRHQGKHRITGLRQKPMSW
jgi:hypothetical protein